MAKKVGENLATLKDKFNKAEIDAKVRKNIPPQSHWHNKFHIDAPYSLINDPNGLCNLNGTYHIFYQWNPVPQNQNWHKNKSWLHTTTKDFINYKMPTLALWPTDVHDKDGCFSGCGFVEDGKVRIFYTCNSRDEDYQRKVAQRFGTLQDDGTIKLDEIAVEGSPEGYTMHFRDPNLFWRNGKKYFAVAAQRMSDTKKSSRPLNGTTVIYGEDGDGWKFLGELKTDYYDFGYMWECPNILQFGDYDVMITCPQGVEHEELQFQNHCLCGYLAGHMSLDSMEMTHGKFQELDKGFDFYAPQVVTHEGRHILFGWIGMPDLVDIAESAIEEGWLYSLTMPRILTLRQGHIYSQPAEEMKALRKLETQIDIDSVKLKEFKQILPKTSEVKLNLEFGSAKKINFTLDYDGEKITFDYNKSTQVMTISREGMKRGGKGIRKFNDGKNFDVDLGTRKFKLFASQTFALNLFVDKSVLELFLQNGDEVATILVYPDKDVTPKFTLTADEELATLHGHIWELGSINFE